MDIYNLILYKYYLLLTTHHSLLITHYLLLTTHYSLLTTHLLTLTCVGGSHGNLTTTFDSTTRNATDYQLLIVEEAQGILHHPPPRPTPPQLLSTLPSRPPLHPTLLHYYPQPQPLTSPSPTRPEPIPARARTRA